VTTNTQNKETCVAASYDVLANLTLSKPPRRTPKVWRRSRAFGFASAVTRTTTASSTTVSGQRYQPESRCFSMHRQRIRPYAKGSRVIRANRSSVEMKPVARASRVIRSDQRRTLKGSQRSNARSCSKRVKPFLIATLQREEYQIPLDLASPSLPAVPRTSACACVKSESPRSLSPLGLA